MFLSIPKRYDYQVFNISKFGQEFSNITSVMEENRTIDKPSDWLIAFIQGSIVELALVDQRRPLPPCLIEARYDPILL